MLLLALVLLPLDLHGVPASAVPDAGSLSVKLELARDASGTRYRITHQFRGNQPMRFVTGATDRNCDEPLDLLWVDGKLTQLWSMLPCGGLAFRATRVVKPGEGWTIEGVVSLAPGPHKVAARYCAGPASLDAIAPAERALASPPWWLHCAESTVVTLDDPPLDAWRALLAALRAGDVSRVSRHTTDAGLASLRRGVRDEPEAIAFARWGNAWATWPLRWIKQTAGQAHAWLGPEVKEHGLVFVRGSDGWRLDRWSPGE